MKIVSNFKNLEEIKRIIIPITMGAVIMSLASNLFIIPAKLLAGGFTGVSILLNSVVDVPVGIIYFILNIPMVLISLKLLSLKSTVYSFYAVFIMSLTQVITQNFIGILGINDIMINTIFGGVLTGIGKGLIYRNGASTMGTDVLGLIGKKYYNINVGNINMAFNIVILLIASYMNGIELALYTILSLYIGSKLGDNMMLGLGERKNIMIITKKTKEISEEIIKKLHRGVTILDAKGAYTNKPSNIILTIVSTGQISKLRSIVQNYDENAFMTISESVEVRGRGFTNYDN